MTSSEIRGLVFDFDGTLVQSTRVKNAAFHALYEPYGADIVDQVLKHHQSHGGINRYEKFCIYNTELLKLPYSEELIEAQARAFAERVVSGVIAAEEIPGATRFLRRCHASGWLCGVNSATPTSELRHIILQRQWNPHFDIVLGSPASKLDNLNKICETWNVQPSSLLFFGDAPEDKLAAEKAGVRFVAIGNHTGAAENYPDFNSYMKSAIRES
jgi:phosphoglycolate phosphatase-like HAD superfamily hydrolase